MTKHVVDRATCFAYLRRHHSDSQLRPRGPRRMNWSAHYSIRMNIRQRTEIQAQLQVSDLSNECVYEGGRIDRL
jgi:hypothetical protein